MIVKLATIAGIFFLAAVSFAAAETIPQTEPLLAPEPVTAAREFCANHPEQCELSAAPAVAISLNLLEEVNELANKEVRVTTDRALWGQDERWEFPVLDVNGDSWEDCDGVALYKRAILRAKGVPVGQLRVGLVGLPVEILPMMLTPEEVRYWTSGDVPEKILYQGKEYIGHVVLVVRDERKSEDWILDQIGGPIRWREYIADGRFFIGLQDEGDFTKFWASFYEGHPGWKAFLAHTTEAGG